MAGYIGKQAVVLSTTAADVNGNADIDGTVTADGLTVDTNTLHVDATNNRVGIGTGSPVGKVDIVHSGNTRTFITEEATDTSVISAVNTSNTAYSDLNIYANNLKLSTSGAERMRIDSSGRVGIGDTSPDRALHVKSGSTNVVAKFESTDAVAAVEFTDNSGSAEIGCAGNDVVIYPSGVEKLRILSSGGITFNGDTAAANALDDYEEGTWTPTVTTGSLSSYSTGQGATYTKVGRLVYAQAYIAWTNTANNNSTAFKIQNLPFTVRGIYGTASLSYCGSANTNDFAPVLHYNSDYMYFHQNDGSSAAILNSDVHSRGLTTLIFSATYETDS